jgi:hypothetical protein
MPAYPGFDAARSGRLIDHGRSPLRFGHAAWYAIAAVNIWMFFAYLLAQLAQTVVLVVYWFLVLPNRGLVSFWLLVWVRILHDATGEFLPFSHAGGLVIGGRAVTSFGVQTMDATASTIVDIVLETFVEIVFVAPGLMLLAWIGAQHTFVVRWLRGSEALPAQLGISQPALSHTVSTLEARLGLTHIPEDVARHHVAEGWLVRVLAKWWPPVSGYHLHYPIRRQPTPAFALLVDALRYRNRSQAGRRS